MGFQLNNPVNGQTQQSQEQNSERAREHLANERTYLAWMRTAIGMMGFGMVIVRLRVFHPPLVPHLGVSWKLGLLFSLVGLLTVLFSSQHYFAVRRDIDNDLYEPRDRWVLLSSIIVTLLGAGAIYFVFTAPLTPVNFVAPSTGLYSSGEGVGKSLKALFFR